MPPLVIKPEAVLKRADELINVGQPAAALQELHEFTYSRRFKQGPAGTLEPLMERLMDLCVEQRRGRAAKDALVQFKNAFQNTETASIEHVVKHFVRVSEAKVAEAQSRADAAAEIQDVDDLEESETPESILLGSVSQDAERDRTDRTLVTPWLKFLWEAYRSALDLIKNNTRLETAYEQTANHALCFCLEHKRKTEFRRLCDVLRQHLQSVARTAHHMNAIDFSDADTLQRHLDTRFLQLNCAVELELWQEAYRSVEDVHNLLTIAKKAPRGAMLADYYDKLARIFIVSDNHLFHAAAWNRYYALARLTENSEEEQERMASFVLLSALAVPVIASSAPGTGNVSKGRTDFLQIDTEARHRTGRLNALLGLSRTPTRAGLLREALNRNVLRRVRPELRALYQILEVEFHPLSICSKIEPILGQISKDSEMAKYVEPLRSVVLTRLFQQLSQVYDSVKLSQVMELVSAFKEPEYTQADVEKFCLNACKRGHLSLRIDHVAQAITFEEDVYRAEDHPANEEDADTVRLQKTPSELVRSQLARLAESLDSVLRVIGGGTVDASQEARAAALARAVKEAAGEHAANLYRKGLVERKKEIVRERAKKREEEAAAAREEALRKQAEAEKERFAEEARRREMERVRKEMDAAKLEEARKIAQTLRERGGLELPEEEFAKLDKEQLVQLQVQQIEKEKKELDERLRAVQRRMDHLERAYRREEAPLLQADYERQQENDRRDHARAREVQLLASRKAHEADLARKERLMRILPDYEEIRRMLLDRRQEEYEENVRWAETEIEKEKEARRMELRRQAEEREAEERAAEERRRAAEAEAAKRAAEEARLAEARREEAEREAKLEAEKRAEIEERQRALRARSVPSVDGGSEADSRSTWRRGPPPPASGVYRPSERRTPTAVPPPSTGGGGKYVPGMFSRMRQQGGAPAPGAAGAGGPGLGNRAAAPQTDADGFEAVKPRSSGAYRPPGRR
ncbi:eukaryotic translation initiation factor 3 subunit A [Malassezia cuniculi]|uniref:Eukaryotic translation initiation factor 3 subunit A n=1 Tax=Malassezia cuniculi TaxID=948313 RepID=A0AAF0EUA0_9BASI|nr:eukaryotic translation initiation factor 3 subunit A [Malassezia cuniculi]